MVNPINNMITSGYMDETNCNLLLFLQGWSPASPIIKNKLLQTSLANYPNYRIWIATYEDEIVRYYYLPFMTGEMAR